MGILAQTQRARPGAPPRAEQRHLLAALPRHRHRDPPPCRCQHGPARRAESAARTAGDLAGQNAGLRRERDRLADQLEAALGYLRRLTIDNVQLRHDLQAARSITRLDPDMNHPSESDVKPFVARSAKTIQRCSRGPKQPSAPVRALTRLTARSGDRFGFTAKLSV